MKIASGLAIFITRSSTRKGASRLWRSALSVSPIDTQVSVTTQSAPPTASSTWSVIVMDAPWARAHSTTSAGGGSSRGQPIRSSKPNRPAAWSQEVAMLLPSPLHATRLLAIGPRCSSNVMTSAIN